MFDAASTLYSVVLSPFANHWFFAISTLLFCISQVLYSTFAYLALSACCLADESKRFVVTCHIGRMNNRSTYKRQKMETEKEVQTLCQHPTIKIAMEEMKQNIQMRKKKSEKKRARSLLYL